VPNLGPWLHPLYGIGGVQFTISRVPVYTAISNFSSSCSQTRRSCFQLANSCLLRGHEGSWLWIDILSFLLPSGIFSRWFVECLVRVICFRSYFSPCLVVVS